MSKIKEEYLDESLLAMTALTQDNNVLGFINFNKVLFHRSFVVSVTTKF
jgi:hypothetical protein